MGIILAFSRQRDNQQRVAHRFVAATSDLFSRIYSVVFDRFFGDAKQLRNAPARQHRFDEHADALLHQRERRITPRDLVDFSAIRTAGGAIGLEPRRVVFSSVGSSTAANAALPCKQVWTALSGAVLELEFGFHFSWSIFFLANKRQRGPTGTVPAHPLSFWQTKRSRSTAPYSQPKSS